MPKNMYAEDSLRWVRPRFRICRTSRQALTTAPGKEMQLSFGIRYEMGVRDAVHPLHSRCSLPL